MKTEFEIDREAIALGAVKKVTNYVTQGHSYWTHEPNRVRWSWHYFRADGLEIAYCIIDMLTVRDWNHLHVLEQPRAWSDYWGMNPENVETPFLCEVPSNV